MTSLMRKSVPSSTPLVALTKVMAGLRCGAIFSKMRRAWCEGTTPTTIPALSSAEARSLVTLTDSGIWWPGRNRSFVRRERMESQTSFSSAQRRRRQEPLPPRTMESAVPHAPAPMMAISDILPVVLGFCRYRGGLLFSELIFFARGQTANVFVVLGDDQGRNQDGSQQ